MTFPIRHTTMSAMSKPRTLLVARTVDCMCKRDGRLVVVGSEAGTMVPSHKDVWQYAVIQLAQNVAAMTGEAGVTGPSLQSQGGT
jgi:hypothetical protein